MTPARETDPLAYNIPLPLSGRYFPMGFAADIATNSAHVLAAADAIWSPFPQLSEAGPVTLRVAVGGP